MTGTLPQLLAAAMVISICAVFVNARRRDRTAIVVWLVFAVIVFCAAAVTP